MTKQITRAWTFASDSNPGVFLKGHVLDVTPKKIKLIKNNTVIFRGLWEPETGGLGAITIKIKKEQQGGYTEPNCYKFAADSLRRPPFEPGLVGLSRMPWSA